MKFKNDNRIVRVSDIDRKDSQLLLNFIYKQGASLLYFLYFMELFS